MSLFITSFERSERGKSEGLDAQKLLLFSIEKVEKLKVLIVDDEKPLVRGLSASLAKEGFNTLAAFDGLEALEVIRREKIDIVLLDIMLLDIMLPGMDGITVLRKLREKSNVPVIMLTAKDDSADMVLGLELGADDYVTKPFNTRVLIARIRSVVRRKSESITTQDIFEFRDIWIDFGLQLLF